MVDSSISGASTNQPELWLVRHGETAWSLERKHTSRTDVPLTPTGEDEARKLGERLAGLYFDLVLTSPLRRAHDTARLAGFPDAQVELTAVEWDYGEYEGVTTAQIREQVPGWTIWSDGAPGGESQDQVGSRADAVISRIQSSGGTRLLLFAHAHFLRVLAARWLGQPVTMGAHYRLDTASVSVLGWERETPAISRWNA